MLTKPVSFSGLIYLNSVLDLTGKVDYPLVTTAVFIFFHHNFPWYLAKEEELHPQGNTVKMAFINVRNYMSYGQPVRG